MTLKPLKNSIKILTSNELDQYIENIKTTISDTQSIIQHKTKDSITITLLQENKPIEAIVYHIPTKRVYYANTKGAFFNDIKIMSKMTNSTPTSNNTALNICLIAEGKYGMLQTTTKTAEMIAAEFILQQAGGRAYDTTTKSEVKFTKESQNITLVAKGKPDFLYIFDVDGVLGDFTKLRQWRDENHIKEVGNIHNIPYKEAEKLYQTTRKECKAKGKPSTIQAMQELGISKERFFQLMNEVSAVGGITPSPHALEVLQQLTRKAVVIAITNTPYKSNVETLKYLKLYEYIDAIYSIDKYDFIKPSTKIFKRMKKDFHCDKGISIGDSIEKDLEPARTAGFQTFHFTNKKDLRELLKIRLHM